jgi:hypothetical protein
LVCSDHPPASVFANARRREVDDAFVSLAAHIDSEKLVPVLAPSTSIERKCERPSRCIHLSRRCRFRAKRRPRANEH